MEACRCNGEHGRRDAVERDQHGAHAHKTNTHSICSCWGAFSFTKTRGAKKKKKKTNTEVRRKERGSGVKLLSSCHDRTPCFYTTEALTGQKGEPGALQNAEHSKIQEISWKCCIDSVDLLFQELAECKVDNNKVAQLDHQRCPHLSHNKPDVILKTINRGRRGLLCSLSVC